jgi:PAS domain S-box-containing protein
VSTGAPRDFEQELSELELLYATTPVGMCLVDTDLRYLRINEQLAAINGSPVDGHLGRTVRGVIPDVAPHVEPIYRRVIETGEPTLDVEVHTEVPSDPGVTRSYLVSFHPLKSPTGEVVAVSVTVKDITNLKRAEAALEQARDELETRVEQRTAELTRANAVLEEEMARGRALEDQLRLRQSMDSIGSLASGLAHDFNNLLQGITANLSLLEYDADQLSERQAGCVRDALGACTRAAGLTRQLRTLSVGALSRKEPTDVHAIASEVFSLLAQTSDRLIEKRLDFGPGELVARASPGELHQVLLNLGTNAVAAIESRPGGARPGDRISLSGERHLVGEGSVEPVRAGRYIHLRFRDSGSGMSAEVRRRAFDPLFTTRERSARHGQGLGLAMVYNIVVNGHAGHAHIESTEGEGTTVHLILPESSLARRREPLVRSRANPMGGSETILVVDDEEVVRKTVRRMLSAHGYRTVTAVDGEDALVKYDECDPDLVVLDLIMPKSSGEAVCTEILKRDPSARIVISSGDAGRRIDEPSLEGARAILFKPYGVPELLGLVRAVLDESDRG